MAYVAKSNRVWEQIESNIKRLFATREDHASSWDTYVDLTEYANMCYRALISEEMEAHMVALPTTILPEDDEFSFRIRGAAPATADIEGISVSAIFYAEFNPKRRFPSHWNGYSHYEDCALKGKNLPPEVFAIALKRERQIQAINTDRDEMIAGAKEIYNKSKSINQFVKLWEPALGLLDSDTVERLRKQVKRNASAEEQGITDEELQKLNSHYVKAKVSQ